MSQDVIEVTDSCEHGSCREGRRGVIINPGAIGDNLLVLPLADYMQKTLALNGVDFIGNSDYIEFLRGRTCLANTRSINSIPLYKLFADTDEFALDEGQILAKSLRSYEWIVSFLGEKQSSFESNLVASIYTSHAANISILPLIPKTSEPGHISRFYIDKFRQANDLEQTDFVFNETGLLIKSFASDIENGTMLIKSQAVDLDRKKLAIHPGSGGKKKCWNFENICSVAKNLKKTDHEIIFLLGPAETERLSTGEKQILADIGKVFSGLTLRQTMQIIASCDAFLGNDSGISHLAAALGKPTMALFGPTDPTVYRPIGPMVRVVTPPNDSFTKPNTQAQAQVTEIAHKMLAD